MAKAAGWRGERRAEGLVRCVCGGGDGGEPRPTTMTAPVMIEEVNAAVLKGLPRERSTPTNTAAALMATLLLANAGTSSRKPELARTNAPAMPCGAIEFHPRLTVATPMPHMDK